jgi:ectoine hydroxylase-related dioxygenase (phytanoyl-CoA dioxygenase family)
MDTQPAWLQTALLDLQPDGFTIIYDFLQQHDQLAVTEQYNALLGHYQGRNPFEGQQTERVYTLVARHRLFQDIASDPRVMALCDAILEPNYLLTASQAISLSPGETPQPWHTDDSFYTLPRPRPMVGLSTIVAIDAFTETNGGTEVVPGSHLWDDEQIAGEYIGADGSADPEFNKRIQALSKPVTMSAGSCMVFSGTLLHRGGENRSPSPRRAFSNQYCQPWARTQENFYLAIPPEEVAQMSPVVQSLLGYSVHPPFMGQVTASHPLKALEPGFVPAAYRRED